MLVLRTHLYNDNSRMQIKTAAPVPVPRRGKVKSVCEAEADLKIEFAEGSTAMFRMDDPGSSLAVRDKNHSVEYLG